MPDSPFGATGIAVYKSTQFPSRFQFSVSGPGGMTFGSAATEAEAWEKAREIAPFHGLEMRGEGQG